MDPFGGEAGPWDRLANRIYLPRPIPSGPCTSVIATIVIHLLNVILESCYYRQK